ncbi:MAG: ASCH domain-containing protein [Gemmatimonadota bacterium]
MKALTMTQPWATLVALGENTIETRSWSTRYRGALAIHTATAFPRSARELCNEEPYRSVLARGGFTSSDALPRGSVIALARLDDVITFTRTSLRETRARSARGLLPEHEADFGDFSPGRFGFVLSHVQRLSTPIAATGMLGLWDVPPGLMKGLVREVET